MVVRDGGDGGEGWWTPLRGMEGWRGSVSAKITLHLNEAAIIYCAASFQFQVCGFGFEVFEFGV